MVGRALTTWLATAGLALGAVAVQESAAVSRLRQEVTDLRFQYDFKTNRLEQRVDQLEQRVRALEGRPVEPVSPTPPPDSEGAARATIVTRRLLLVDEAGVRRGALSVSERFGPMLALTDAGGQVRLMLSVPPEGPRVELLDAGGTLRSTFAVYHAVPRWEIADETGAPVLVATIREGAGVIEPHRRP